MVFPWVYRIRNTHELSVYNGMATSRWVKLFKEALAGFNKLSDDHKLGSG